MNKLVKHAAKSGKGSWTTPDTIMESSTRKIELRPFYYQTNSGEQKLTLGIDVYLKDRKATDWKKSKDKSFTVKADRVEKFYEATKRFIAITGVEDEQQVVVTQVLDHEQLVKLEPGKLLKAAGTLLADSHAQLNSFDLEQELVSAIAGHMKYRTLRDAANDLSLMVRDDALVEAHFQKWFEENYWVFGSGYVARDEVRSISSSDNVDILLKRTANGLRDIVEVKRPTTDVLIHDVSRDVYSFSAAVSAAIGQCARYLDVFEQGASRGGLLDSPQIVARQPRAIIVVGRSLDWSDKKLHALHRLNSRLHGITVRTFDEVLDEARCLLDLIGVKGSSIPNIDEIPF